MPKDNQDLTNEHINETIGKLQAVLADEPAPIAVYCLQFLSGYVAGALQARGDEEVMHFLMLSIKQGAEFGHQCGLEDNTAPAAAANEAGDVPAQNAPTSQARN